MLLTMLTQGQLLVGVILCYDAPETETDVFVCPSPAATADLKTMTKTPSRTRDQTPAARRFF